MIQKMTLMNNVKSLNIISRIVILAREFVKKERIREIHKKYNKPDSQTSMKQFLNTKSGNYQFKKAKWKKRLLSLK
jgi:hypothetical protein